MALADTDLGLAAAVEQPIAWLPVEHDWAFRASDPTGGFNRYGWDERDQERFDTCWIPSADALVDGLMPAFGAMWPWLIGRVATAREPGFADAVRGLAERQEVGRGHFYRDDPKIVYDHAMMYGSFDHVRRARGPDAWPDPSVRTCPICGSDFSPAILSHWMLRQYGPPRYCNRCCVRARNGISEGGRGGVVAGVQRLAKAIDGIPDQALAARVALAGLSDDDRDRAMVGLIVAPAPQYAKDQVGGTWLQVLQAAELVGDAWRPARGTYCTAVDGHRCRSLAERTVDDYLASHGIEHKPEPRYPGSTRKADWGLTDGTLVEYAGLMSDQEYRAKIEDKRSIAAAAGVRLVIVLPEDLTGLGLVFEPWLG